MALSRFPQGIFQIASLVSKKGPGFALVPEHLVLLPGSAIEIHQRVSRVLL